MDEEAEYSEGAFAGGGGSALVVLMGQGYYFLQHGEWPQISVITALSHITRPDTPAWLVYPYDWVGIHKLLEHVPLAVAIIPFGVVFGLAFTFVYRTFDHLVKILGSNLR